MSAAAMLLTSAIVAVAGVLIVAIALAIVPTFAPSRRTSRARQAGLRAVERELSRDV